MDFLIFSNIFKYVGVFVSNMLTVTNQWSTFPKIKSLGPLEVLTVLSYIENSFGDFPLYSMTNGNLSSTASQKMVKTFLSKQIFVKFSFMNVLSKYGRINDIFSADN